LWGKRVVFEFDLLRRHGVPVVPDPVPGAEVSTPDPGQAITYLGNWSVASMLGSSYRAPEE